ncbi:MAG: enoyl-CoA hydratase/isomerase family protein, partial [Vicinamibacterales bacterium]
MSDPTTPPSTIRLKRPRPQTARIVFSNPPVNLVVPETIVALRNVIAQLEQDKDIKVVVLESE